MTKNDDKKTIIEIAGYDEYVYYMGESGFIKISTTMLSDKRTVISNVYSDKDRIYIKFGIGDTNIRSFFSMKGQSQTYSGDDSVSKVFLDVEGKDKIDLKDYNVVELDVYNSKTEESRRGYTVSYETLKNGFSLSNKGMCFSSDSSISDTLIIRIKGMNINDVKKSKIKITNVDVFVDKKDLDAVTRYWTKES